MFNENQQENVAATKTNAILSAINSIRTSELGR